MKIISCDNCGVLLDQDKLSFAEDKYDEDGIDPSKAAWNQREHEYSLYVPCPVCKAEVFKE